MSPARDERRQAVLGPSVRRLMWALVAWSLLCALLAWVL